MINPTDREAFEKWAATIDPKTGYKNGNVLFYEEIAHRYVVPIDKKIAEAVLKAAGVKYE